MSTNSIEFKKLSDVNVIESISDTLNVLVEDNGEVVKIAANNLVPEDVVTQSEMEEAIAAIGTAPVVEELAENAHVLVEQNGAYARVPKDKMGGSDAIVIVGEEGEYTCNVDYQTFKDKFGLVPFRYVRGAVICNFARLIIEDGYMEIYVGEDFDLLKFSEDGTLGILLA